MTKIGTYKRLLAIFMAIIFLSPILIKVTHKLYMHCGCSHYVPVANKPELHKKHEKCLVCSFEFVTFIANKILQFSGKPELLQVFNIAYANSIRKTIQYYSFNLRAPPVC